MNSHWTAFGSLFFLLHQDRLLWLLNAPIIGRWFRYVLRISGESSAVGSLKIDRILPHAIFWWHGDKQVAEFRTHAKFSKRLYYAFKPLWWAMHAWDWCVADRWVPELSFGFSVLTAYPDADPETNTVDGLVRMGFENGSGLTWANMRGGAGNQGSAYDNLPEEIFTNIAADSVLGTGYWYQLGRYICLFDTSSLTSAATISAVVLSLYGSFKEDPGTISHNIDIYTSAPASNTAIADGDFDSFGTTSQTGSPISYASFSISGYNAFTFNATGRGNISKTGISKFGTRNANYDVANVEPTWWNGTASYLGGWQADQTGTANDPKLVVTYTLSNDISYVDIILSSTDT